MHLVLAVVVEVEVVQAVLEDHHPVHHLEGVEEEAEAEVEEAVAPHLQTGLVLQPPRKISLPPSLIRTFPSPIQLRIPRMREKNHSANSISSSLYPFCSCLLLLSWTSL